MSNVIDFYSDRKILNEEKNFYNDINLFDWSGRDGEYGVRKEDELREIFLYMDIALKYVHDNGYYIYSFDPRNIILLDGKPDCILYTIVMKLPNNMMERKKCIQTDIFLSACLQVGIYTNTLRHLNDEFLKNNFDEFAKHIPQGDVPYYRGVIVRNSAVYLCEFDVEKRKRDYENFAKEYENEAGGFSQNKKMIKNNDKNIIDFPLPSNRNNDYIYKTIGKQNSSAAFINYLLIPTIIISLGVSVGLLLLLFSAF